MYSTAEIDTGSGWHQLMVPGDGRWMSHAGASMHDGFSLIVLCEFKEPWFHELREASKDQRVVKFKFFGDDAVLAVVLDPGNRSTSPMLTSEHRTALQIIGRVVEAVS